jgi:hypothetical protein
VALEFAHTVFELAETVSVGIGFTLTVTVSGALAQPLPVPVTVYTVVVVGEAVGLELLGLFSPVEFVHVYVLAPLTDKPVPLPLQIV